MYPESVEVFLKNIRVIKSEGIEIVGGCCGTTPDYWFYPAFRRPNPFSATPISIMTAASATKR